MLSVVQIVEDHSLDDTFFCRVVLPGPGPVKTDAFCRSSRRREHRWKTRSTVWSLLELMRATLSAVLLLIIIEATSGRLWRTCSTFGPHWSC